MPLPLLHHRAFANDCETLSLRPADALCRPPEPARLGRISIDPRQQPARVTRSSTSCDVEDRLRRCLLLLLPASCLLRRLLRRCFRLSLLRHCCPPSLSGWRHRCSAVANRAALPSDYYSRKKITVTPLNFVCKPRPPRAAASAQRPSAKSTAKNFCGAVIARKKIRCAAEVPMKYGFLLHPAEQIFIARARIARPAYAFARAP